MDILLPLLPLAISVLAVQWNYNTKARTRSKEFCLVLLAISIVPLVFTYADLTLLFWLAKIAVQLAPRRTLYFVGSTCCSVLPKTMSPDFRCRTFQASGLARISPISELHFLCVSLSEAVNLRWFGPGVTKSH